MITPSKLMKANVWRFSFSSNLSRFSGERRSYFSAWGDTSRFQHNHSHWLCRKCGGQCENWCANVQMANVQIEPFLTIYFTLRSQKIKKWCLFEDIFPSRMGGSIYVQISIAQISKRLTHPQLNSHFGPLLNKSVNITMEGPNVKCLYHGASLFKTATSGFGWKINKLNLQWLLFRFNCLEDEED